MYHRHWTFRWFFPFFFLCFIIYIIIITGSRRNLYNTYTCTRFNLTLFFIRKAMNSSPCAHIMKCTCNCVYATKKDRFWLLKWYILREYVKLFVYLIYDQGLSVTTLTFSPIYEIYMWLLARVYVYALIFEWSHIWCWNTCTYNAHPIWHLCG